MTSGDSKTHVDGICDTETIELELHKIASMSTSLMLFY